MRVVVALGGNALLERGERPDAAVQADRVRAAARALAPIAAEHELVVCHGNGPQVGLLALESADDHSLTRPYPLDMLVAETQGLIGYLLSQALTAAGVRAPVVNLTTQTVVAADDPAFAAPTKFVGAVYSRVVARSVGAARGWTFAPDGEGWRRVVPSPRPVRVVERATVGALVELGHVVVCGGGGGVPVVDAVGGLRGVEAVVDKDATAALLARDLGADRLVVLTDVPGVERNFGTASAVAVDRLDLDEAGSLVVPPGSMGPKLAACCEFVAATGRSASIGALDDAAAVLAGTRGTTIDIGTGARR